MLVQPEAGTISHSLATALVDGEGMITHIWRGNGWKPAEVIAALTGKGGEAVSRAGQQSGGR
ncbi:hypothetical protein BH20VER3_BH20VER3_20920 [soil metagenome]